MPIEERIRSRIDEELGVILLYSSMRRRSFQTGADHGFHGPARGLSQLANECSAAGIDGNERDIVAMKVSSQRRRDHSSLPRSPAQRSDQTTWAPSRFGGGHFVEHFVRRGVVALSGVAETRRDRREEADHL